MSFFDGFIFGGEVSFVSSFDSLQAAKGDNESAEVIANISNQLNGETLNTEQEALVGEQLLQQEALELRHREEQRLAERQTDEELAKHQRVINDQINQQKRLVRDGSVGLGWITAVLGLLLLWWKEESLFVLFIFIEPVDLLD